VLFALWAGVRAWRDRSWLSFTRSAYQISIFYLLVAVTWLFPWYGLWPVALAALMPAGWETLLAQVMAFNFTLRPFVYAGLFLHKRIGATPRWIELRLGPAVLGAAWLTAAGLFVIGLLARLRRARAAVSLRRA
jgi:hypothetical protein